MEKSKMKQNRGSNGTQRFIEKLKILKEQGIDVTKITQKDTIETLAKKSGVVISEEQAEKLGIELIDRIGKAKMNITNTYRGNGSYEMPTKEQVQILSELGVSLELLEKRNIVQEFIEKLEILKEQGIDVTKITRTDTIQTLAEKSGVVLTEKKAKELGIELIDRIGNAKMNITNAYRGNGCYKKLTKEEVQKLQNLGINLEKRDITQEFIEKLKILEKQGIDVSNIQTTYTIQTLAEKSGVVITEEKAEELGIKLSDKIGITKTYIARAYRGKGACKKPSQEQVQELLELGISLEARDVIQEFIEKLEILKEQGIDVTKIIQKDTIETLAEKSGVVLTEEKAEELGIELSDKIGITKTYIASAHRGKGYGKKPSQDQVQSLLELGISLGLLRKKDMIQEFIKKIEILKEQGIDVTKIAQKDTIETLAEKSGVIITEEKVKELGIELSDKIGQTKKNIISAYRGNEQYKKPTKEEVQKLQNLGINLEARDTTQEFIEKLEILTKLGVNVAKINSRDTIRTLAKKSGIVLTEEQAKKLGIKLSDKIGYTKMSIARAYRGKGACKKPSQEQVQELLELGISLEARDVIQEFIEKLEILKEQGIDVTKIIQKDTIETLAEKSGVVLTEEKAEELGIELSDKIGITKTYIASAHRGKGSGKKPTQEQVQELQNLGISLEKRKRTGKEIAEASISSIKNMEVSDKADRELKEVVKEVENKKSNQK